MVSALTCEQLANILQRTLYDTTINVKKFEVKAACEEGENYMSIVDRVTIEATRVEHQDGGDTKDFTVSVIVKSLPNNPERREMFHSALVFKNEAAAYNILIPSLLSVGQKDLPFVRCLYSQVHDKLDDIIVLEDLSPQGYCLGERRRGLDSSHCMVVARELARLHARSLAAKILNPQALKVAKDALTEVVFFPGAINSFGLSFDNAIKMGADSLRDNAGGDTYILDLADTLEQLQLQCENATSSSTTELTSRKCDQCHPPNVSDNSSPCRGVFKRIMQLLVPQEPYAVVQHGDCWVNNLFFSYNTDGTVRDVRFLDLQIMRYSSPIIDILHFVYTSTAGTDLKTELNMFISQYHESLRSELLHLGVDPDTKIQGLSVCPSISWLHKESRRLGLYGLAMGLMLLPAITVANEHAPKLENVENKDDFHSAQAVASLTANLPPEYARRAKNLILESVRLGIL